MLALLLVSLSCLLLYLLDLSGGEVEVLLGGKSHPLRHPHAMRPAVEISAVQVQERAAQSQLFHQG